MNAQDRRNLQKLLNQAQIALGNLEEVRSALEEMAGDEEVNCRT